MEVCAYMIGMVKTNTKLFCKYTTDSMKKYWPGGFYIMLKSKSTVPWDRPLIAIG